MKLRVLIMEAEGTEAIKELLAILPMQFTPPEPVMPSVVPPRIASPPAKQLSVAKREKPKALPAKAATVRSEPTAHANGTRGPNWSLYPIRVAQSRKPSCRLCPRAIEIGEEFRDGGLESLRAHVECVEKVQAKAA